MRRPIGRALAVISCALACLAASASAQSPRAFVPPARPALDAAESLLVESDTGATVLARDPNSEVAIASVTKLMTAYVTLQHEPLTKLLLEHPYAAGYGESLAGLVPGRHYTVRGMLEALLLPSGNDAANSLAIDVGGSVPRFVAQMNAAARDLGLGDTHFATPVGLDTPGNYSTARDLARLAQVLLRIPAFARIVRKPYAYLRGGLLVRNRDQLLGSYPFVVGVKEGHTADAGWCFVGAASADGVHLVSVVLGEPSEGREFADTLALLEYGLALYHRVRLAVTGRVYATVAANGGTQQAALVAARPASLVLRHGARFDVHPEGVPVQLEGPIAAGTQEGELVVTEDGRQLLSVPLVTRDELPAPVVPSGPTLPPPAVVGLADWPGV
jgi:serine-type D-Ala-D-Ala carboxypeptidase (penicillin-binding protein 5/6)